MRFSFRIDPVLAAATRNAAARLGVTDSDLMRAALRKYVEALKADEVLALQDPETGPKLEARRVQQQRASELLGSV